jgi:hypothetical protein
MIFFHCDILSVFLSLLAIYLVRSTVVCPVEFPSLDFAVYNHTVPLSFDFTLCKLLGPEAWSGSGPGFWWKRWVSSGVHFLLHHSRRCKTSFPPSGDVKIDLWVQVLNSEPFKSWSPSLQTQAHVWNGFASTHPHLHLCVLTTCLHPFRYFICINWFIFH